MRRENDNHNKDDKDRVVVVEDKKKSDMCVYIP